MAVLIPGREHGEYVVFCREKDKERELWDGYRAGQDGAATEYGADDAFPIADVDDILPGLDRGSRASVLRHGRQSGFRPPIDQLDQCHSQQGAHLGATPPNEFVALDHLLHDMRLYKSAAEVKVMREAAQISPRRTRGSCRYAGREAGNTS